MGGPAINQQPPRFNQLIETQKPDNCFMFHLLLYDPNKSVFIRSQTQTCQLRQSVSIFDTQNPRESLGVCSLGDCPQHWLMKLQQSRSYGLKISAIGWTWFTHLALVKPPIPIAGIWPIWVALFPDVECRLCGVSCVQCKVWSVKCRMWGVKCRVLNVECAV